MSLKRQLTRSQKQLVAELDDIAALSGHDYWKILDRQVSGAERTTILQVILRETVRGQVVSKYTLIDEHLGSKVCNYMFDNRELPQLWKTKKFERFNYYVLERMSLMEKLAFITDVYRVPRAIAADIEQINAIRNDLAHAFFPENLRSHRAKYGSALRRLVGPRYKGVDIFTFAGFHRFFHDALSVMKFFGTEILGGHRCHNVILRLRAKGCAT